MKKIEFIENLKLIRSSRVMELELVEALAYLRNIVILGNGSSASAELVLEELAGISNALKPAFQDMAHFLHTNDKASAEMVLYKYMDTGFSKDLGRFLAGWNDIPPGELLGNLEIYLDSLREDIIDQKQKRNEIISDLIYFPVVINAMLVLVDFIYVAFYIEQQAMFTNLFM